MLVTFLPLLLLLVVILAVMIIVFKLCRGGSMRGPSEKEGMRKGLMVALLTDSWLLGWLYAKRNSDYDYDNRRLKK